jgi:DNA-binding NtrC family response regulator
LNIVDVKIPPLRERRGEILPLCEVFLEKHSTPDWPRLELDTILRQVLVEYSWPGNIRELENLMRKYLVLRSSSMIAAEIRQRTVGSKTVFVPARESIREGISTPESVEGANSTRTTLDSVERVPDSSNTPTVIRTNGQSTAYAASHHEFGGTPHVFRAPAESEDESQSLLSRLDHAGKAAEAEAIVSALQSTMWNRKRAAVLLSIDYKALLYKMKKLGIGEQRTACG